ncbi:glucose PTS transporter subunit IIA [Saccharibacillus sacchari]|uniref:glucose PTS transporter subunit IIA n=1 Tax=Saccharibacillus sacchari TaxID=456493 RepID=UPI0004B0596D|nr:glucose PTS transporter subunit IIA [Saccharibacillus sacchari]
MFTKLLELLKRAGSGARKSEASTFVSSGKPNGADELPRQLLSALGGQDNVLNLDACTTRLRVRVAENGQVDKERLRQLGALGVWEMDHDEVHVLLGARSDAIKSQMQAMVAERALNEDSFSVQTADQQVIDKNKAEGDIIVSPADGELLDLSSVPDSFFSRRMIGDGFAVLPSSGRILSPVGGTVLTVFPGKHAVGILSEAGIEILVHIGVNTVKLKGHGFNVCVAEGDRVAPGQPILEVDLEDVKKHAASIITPVVFMNLPGEAAVQLLKPGTVRAGEPSIIRIMARGSQIFK